MILDDASVPGRGCPLLSTHVGNIWRYSLTGKMFPWTPVSTLPFICDTSLFIHEELDLGSNSPTDFHHQHCADLDAFER